MEKFKISFLLHIKYRKRLRMYASWARIIISDFHIRLSNMDGRRSEEHKFAYEKILDNVAGENLENRGKCRENRIVFVCGELEKVLKGKRR